MTEGMIEGHDASDEAHADRLLDTFGYEEGAFDELDDGVEVPFRVILLREDLGNIHLSTGEKVLKWSEYTCASTKVDWNCLSSMFIPIFSLTCSTCRWPRRTASSTEFALLDQRKPTFSFLSDTATLNSPRPHLLHTRIRFQLRPIPVETIDRR